MSVLIAKPSTVKANTNAPIATIKHQRASVRIGVFGERAKEYSTSDANKATMIRSAAAAPTSLATSGLICGETRATITVSKRPKPLLYFLLRLLFTSLNASSF
jgi:hypothetical protein